MNKGFRSVGPVVLPILFGVLFLGVWELIVRVNDISSFILVKPSDIWSRFVEDIDHIRPAVWYTATNALVGLVIGTLVAILLAAVATRVRIFGEIVNPLIAALAAVPIICVVPLLNNMYSLNSTLPRRTTVAIAVLIPVFVNTLRGLRQLAPVHRELMASYAASGTDVLRLIRIPGALPHLFTGLRIASSVSVITAVVSEYLGGRSLGIGQRIQYSVGGSNYKSAWASIFAAVLLGLTFFLVVLAVERLILGRRAASLT